MNHELKKGMVSGIRAFLLSFFVVLLINITTMNRDSISNFVMIFFITLINAFLIGTSAFIRTYSYNMHHLKGIAVIIVLMTLFVFTYLEYPIALKTIDKGKLQSTINQQSEPDVEILIGKVNFVRNGSRVIKKG
jgi:hypothetical protein